MGLQLFNSKSREIEEFKPLKGNTVRMYACGPTVYGYAHIGNLRTFVWTDLLRRYLKYKGYTLEHVMNITDVDDKTIKRCKKEKKALSEVTKKYTKAFFEDCDALGIERPETITKATEHIKEMVALVEKLKKKGLAYDADDGVYFKVADYKEYGTLVQLAGLEAGKSGRVKADEYDKDNVQDFVLWKLWDKDDGDVFWETSLGKGRPGWHIECSAMSMKYLGEHFDIHTGGVDLKFPHHENEIAQSKGATGKDFVHFWLHAEHLVVDGKKMAKSFGNYYTLRDILKKGYSAKAVRWLFLSHHYRQLLNFTFEGLKGTETTLKSFYDFLDRLDDMNGKAQVKDLLKDAQQDFEKHMDNDLHISEALAVIFDLMHEINKLGELTKKDAAQVKAFFYKIDGILGVLDHEKVEVPDDVQRLVEEREDARKKKDFAGADKIRDKIEKLGYVVEDTPKGPRVKQL